MERGTPLPQFILDVDISSTSKILFALLLNRANLSQKNVWEDDEGHVYCTYTIEDMAKDMNKGMTAIKNSLNELTREGLLERVRVDFGRANHLYIKISVGADTVSKPPVIKPEKQQAVGYKSAPNKARYPSTNNYNKSLNYNNQRDERFLDYSFKEGERL